jgi:hypothetical protein
LLFSQPFGFGVGFCGFLSGFFPSELKNMSCSFPLCWHRNYNGARSNSNHN